MINKKEKGDLLELKLGTQFRTDILNSVFQLKHNDIIISEPVDYQNNLKYSSNNLYFSVKYRFKFEKLSLLTQAGFHQLFNRLENRHEAKKQSPFLSIPKSD